MKVVVAESEEMVGLVPAELEKVFAGMKDAGVLRDGIGAIEVKHLKPLRAIERASTDRQELVRGRDAHRSEFTVHLRGRRIAKCIHGLEVALGVSRVTVQPARAYTFTRIQIYLVERKHDVIGRVGRRGLVNIIDVS